MAFDINARLRISSVANLATIANDIRREVTRALQNVPISVQVNISGNAASVFQNLTGSIGQFSRALQSLQGLANSTANSLSKLYNIQGPVGAVSNINNYGVGLQQLGLQAKQAAFSFEQFGEQAGLAVRRFLAFSIAAGGIIGLVSAIRNGIESAIKFNTEMVRVAQVSDEGTLAIGKVSREIDRVSTAYGVSSLELAKAAVIIKQAGFNSEQTANSIQVLAQAALSPNFGSMEDNVRGLVAVMSQFKLTTSQAAEALNAINAVAAATTVDAKDIVEAISKAGGAFATVGGDYREFIAIFTSIKNVTQESAESIGTGLRTIFARLQDANNVTALENLNIQLRRTREEAEALNRQNISDGRGGTRRFYEGEFVGPNEAIRRIQSRTENLDPNSPQFADIVSRLGGQRQVARVLPLLQQGPQQQQLLNVINASQLSLENSQKLGLTSVENQLGRLNEKFLSLFRTVGNDRSLFDFKELMVGLAVNIAGTNYGLIDFAKLLTPLVPLIATIGAAKASISVLPFLGGIGEKFGLSSGAGFQYGDLGIGNRLNRFSTPTISGNGVNLQNVQLTDVSARLFNDLNANGPITPFANNFIQTLRRDIQSRNPNLQSGQIDQLVQGELGNIQNRFQLFNDNRRAFRQLNGVIQNPNTPPLQVTEALQRRQELIETQNQIQKQTGVAVDANGNFVGYGGRLFQGSENDITRAINRDRRNFLVAGGLSLAGGLVSYSSGSADEAIRRGNPESFVLTNTLGGTLTGAGVGYGLGTTVSSSAAAGPYGAALGAVVLGLQTLASSLDEVRRTNIAKTFSDIATAQGRLLEALQKGNVTSNDIKLNVESNQRSASQNIYNRGYNLLGFANAYPFARDITSNFFNPNDFTRRNIRSVENSPDENTRISLQQIYSRPELVRNNTSLVQQEVRRILRQNPENLQNSQSGVNALNQINNESNPYNLNLRFLAYSQGYLNTSKFINSEEGRRLVEQLRLEEILANTNKEFNSVNTQLINFALGIKRITESFTQFENSINSSIAVSQGNFSNIRIASPNLDNLLGSGNLVSSISDLPSQYRTVGLANRLNAIDAIGAGASRVTAGLSTGPTFGDDIANRLERLNPEVYRTPEGRQVLTNVRNRLGARLNTNQERQRELIDNPDELQREINSAGKDLLKSIQEFADAYRQQIQREIQIRNEGNKLLIDSISQQRAANNAVLEAQRQRAQFTADNSFRGNEFVRFFSQGQADRPFNQQINELISGTPFGNINRNPRVLGQILNGLNTEYNTLSQNPVQNRERLSQLNDQIFRVTQALKLYTDVQGRVNFLTQRYQFLQEERQGRVNFARTALFADDGQRFELNRGFNLFQSLLGGNGNLDLNRLGSDTDRRSVISFLESARGISFDTNSGPQRAENIVQQLLASLYGGQVLPNGADQELQTIQREIANRMDQAAQALQGLATNTANQAQIIGNAIAEQNRKFLEDLNNLFRNFFGEQRIR